MILDFRAGRRSPCSLLLFSAISLVLISLAFLARPYVGSVRAKFPELTDKITATIGSFHKPAAGSQTQDHAAPPSSSPSSGVDYNHHPDANTTAQNLWAKLQPLLDDNPPNVPEIEGWDGLDFSDFQPQATDLTEDVLNVQVLDIVKMRQAHRKFVEGMQEQFQQHTSNAASVRKGIVTTAAGYYLPVFMVSLRMLRRTGTALPVEIWMNTQDEYEPYICEQVLPTMNAECKVLEDIFHHDGKKFVMKQEIEHFQFKIFAILFSSFQEVLWLDADNFPMHQPDELFHNEPFKSTGMVIWPDFWFRTVSPTYHLINGKEPEHRGVRPAAETGQMMLNKVTHLQVLLLAAYYNYYGPSHYYGLLCQNGPGRGDKETFIPAATTLNMPFYQVHNPVKAVGHEKMQGDGIWIFAMIQYDAVQDYQNATKSLKSGLDHTTSPRPFFLHCNTPKWNPKNVFDHVGSYDLTWDIHQNPATAFSDPPEIVAELNGIEHAMWHEVKWVACELEGKFKDWEGRDDVCQGVEHYFRTFLEPEPGAMIDVPLEAPPTYVETNEDGGVQVNYEENGQGDEHLVMNNDGEVKGNPGDSNERNGHYDGHEIKSDGLENGVSGRSDNREKRTGSGRRNRGKRSGSSVWIDA